MCIEEEKYNSVICITKNSSQSCSSSSIHPIFCEEQNNPLDLSTTQC